MELFPRKITPFALGALLCSAVMAFSVGIFSPIISGGEGEDFVAAVGQNNFDPESLDPSTIKLGGAVELTDAGVLEGWALDIENISAPVEVKINFYDHSAKQFVYNSTILVQSPSAHIPELKEVEGNHAFSYVIPPDFRDGDQYSIFVTAFVPGTGIEEELTGSPKSFVSSLSF